MALAAVIYMHTPYKLNLKHSADFRVKYRFYSEAEGGRTITPSQGYRSDFWYDDPEHKPKQIFCIWPEFENKEGQTLIQKEVSVDYEGTAKMWIANPQMRPYHYNKIKPGLRGFFMEGGTRVAECEVIEVLGLLTNPTVFE